MSNQFKSLDVGLHRTVQWGGDGQDNSFNNFLETFVSIRVDNQDGSLCTVNGNQIAGLDVRWRLTISGISNIGTWRAYIEATDTSIAWFKGHDRNNTIYNHGTYTDGYRHLGV